MATFLQKIFLPKSKLYILDAIKQNADKIEYYYDEHGLYKYHNLTICTQDIVLHSRLIACDLSTMPIASYQFEQKEPSGRIISKHSDECSIFSDKVHAEMFKAFTKIHGLDVIYSTQEQFRKQHKKQR